MNGEPKLIKGHDAVSCILVGSLLPAKSRVRTDGTGVICGYRVEEIEDFLTEKS